MLTSPSFFQFFGFSRSGSIAGIPIFPILAALFLIATVVPLPACAGEMSSLDETIGTLTSYQRVPGLDDRVVADYIAGRLKKYGYAVHEEPFTVETDTGSATTWNVVGIKEGFGQGAVVVCAHYDVPDPNCPGADDNAAGVAVMLEVARALQTEPLNRSVYFIAFSGEETGLWGSADWLERHADLAGEIVAAVNLDCVARGDELYVETLPQYRWILDTVPESPTINPQIGSGLGGDHWRFWERHVPAVLISDNSGYTLRHTPDDTPEALNLSLATSCTEAVTGMVRTLASAGDATPPMVEGSVEEDGTIRYTISEPSITQLIIDGTDFGTFESGQVTLPPGPHTVRIVAYGAAGNRGILDLQADVLSTGRGPPGSDLQPEGITIPWKRTNEEREKFGMQCYITPFVSLSYNCPEKRDPETRVDGYVDGLRIAGLEDGHIVVYVPGPHQYEVIAIASGAVVGYDETTFLVKRMQENSTAYYIRNDPLLQEPFREKLPLLVPIACVVAALLLIGGYLFSRRGLR